MLLKIYSACLSCLEEAAPCSSEVGSVCTQEQCTWRHVSTSGGTCRLHNSQNSRHFPVKSFHASSLVLCLKHETKYLEKSNASVSCVDHLPPRMSKTSVSKPVLHPSPINRWQKPNSWTFNFVEVSGHNLESSQTWCFCMDFPNHWEGDIVFHQAFLLSPS